MADDVFAQLLTQLHTAPRGSAEGAEALLAIDAGLASGRS